MDEIINKELESGKIVISEDVLCTIASIAASEAEGVENMSGSIVGGIAEMIGKKNNSKGIKVSIDENVVNVEVHFVAKYGVKLTEVCWDIQQKVKKAIETMCGMDVSAVNVFVESVHIEKEAKKEETEEIETEE